MSTKKTENLITRLKAGETILDDARSDPGFY
jgi:hypothetical protein